MSDKPSHLHDQMDPVDESHVRGKFASQIGFMLAAVGSAVGLGNIWKFPYITGENGGGAFILVYLACVLLVALPILIVEFAVGRRGQTSAIGSYRIIAPGRPWWLNGLLGIGAAFTILGFYSAVAGWVLRYMVIGMTDGFATYNAETSGTAFLGLIDDPGGAILYQGIIMLFTALVIYFGIEKGIERASKFLMPLLFLTLIILLVRSLTLPGAHKGLAFVLSPDFSKLKGTSILEALGHSFFTLSIGMGAMITYGSYVGKEVHLAKTGVIVAAMDTLVALLAGLVIFPALFSFGMEPGQGPSLIFITLPQVFAQMPAGNFFGTAFFFLILVAALTSTISILEPVVTWLVDDLNMKRHIATAISGIAVFLFGIPACLSAHSGGKLGGFLIPFLGKKLSFFDLLDTLSTQFMLPIGGLVACLFLAIAWNRQEAMREVAGEKGDAGTWFIKTWYILAVTLAPLGILAIMIYGIYKFLQPAP